MQTSFDDDAHRLLFHESDRRLASIVETSTDAIVSEDLNGIVKSWNRGAERLFGYTAEEMVGQPILLLDPRGPPERGGVRSSIASGAASR